MTVHFLPWDKNYNLSEKANRLYDAATTFDCIEAGDLVAVKLHVGELGNPNYIQPFFVHEITRQIKARGGKPFLTDSNTYYMAQRHNAVDHMQTALINGFNLAPFIVADGLKSENFTLIKTKGILNEIEVSGAIIQADAMIVISHCKGHELSGFGAAIKNLSMGCTPQAGKLRQHRTIGLEITTSKCIGCGKCKDACAFHLPNIIDGKASITSKDCMRCPVCISVCPTKALHYTNKPNLSKALASAAYGILSTFKPKKVSYINFAKDISEGCDCLPNPGSNIFQDIGIFASDSAVSIDAAFLKSINYKTFNEASGVDCMTQVQEAATLGIAGEIEPKIETLN
ncbi:MAG: DUF362 domain-containing protein [Nitrososphaerota archaeon]|jgi:uncharacterized Fe-S center protein|nr:DUF362 domain-containing protein [Nitrososphaerota archaeon]